MKSFKILVITAFCFFSFEKTGYSHLKFERYNCPDFQIIVTSKVPDINLANGEIEVECKACKGKIRYLFADAKKSPINANEMNNLVRNLTAGVYYCFIVNEEGCSKEITIDLK